MKAIGLLCLGLAMLLASACGRDIGDECQTSVDCDPNGTRSCDLSQPGGYCTVLGCDERSCPQDSVCIRYFPVMYLQTTCDPGCEDYQCDFECPASANGACLPPCVDTDTSKPEATRHNCPQGTTNACNANEVCLDSRLCAPRSLEKRSCAKTCSSNDDCRGGYECRRTGGDNGSMLLSGTPGSTASFCAPATN